jgi:hypothetical protein
MLTCTVCTHTLPCPYRHDQLTPDQRRKAAMAAPRPALTNERTPDADQREDRPAPGQDRS